MVQRVVDAEIQHKLAAARTRLILDKPFLGALVLRLPLIAADASWCKTATTNARELYYNQDYISTLGIDETQFVLAKQALHCALSHLTRRQHRSRRRWQLACDYAVNPLLINDGLQAPPGTLVDDGFTGMTAEEIYHYVSETEDTSKTQKQDTKSDDSASKPRPDKGDQSLHQQARDNAAAAAQKLAGRPAELTVQQQEQLAIQWQQRLAGAAQQAMQAGKLGSHMARVVDFMLQPKLPWRALLARYVTASARDDYNYSRPSSRRGDPAIFPSLRSTQINVAVGIDVSGSINNHEMDEFIAEIDAIKGNVRARITLLPCDAALAAGAPWIFEPWENLQLPTSITGGGGTDFCPVFTWIEQQPLHPDLLVYFTDCQGTFPAEMPGYPVIWLVKGKQPVPWGQRVQLN